MSRTLFPDAELARTAIRNLRAQKIRTLLTLLGVVIGIGAIVALVSIAQGLNAAVTEQFKSIGSSTLVVLPGAGFAESMLAKLHTDDAELIESVRGVELVTKVYMDAKQVEFRGEKQTVVVIGVDPAESDRLATMGFLDIAEGRTLRTQDKSAVLVGPNVAAEMFKSAVYLRQNIAIGGEEFRVVGISRKAKNSFAAFFNSAVVMPVSEFEDLTGEEPTPDRIMVRVREGYDMDVVKESIISVLKRDHDKEDFQVMTASQISETAGAVIGIIGLVLVGIAAISLVVGGIGIMNTMFMAVMERTQEIGVMKAIGATNRRVLSIFLFESGMIGFVGGAAGTLLGFLVSAVVSMAAGFLEVEMPFVIDPILVVGALVFSMLVGIVSGISPAMRAAHLDPVEALRRE